MKSTLLIFCLCSLSVMAQNHEFDINYRFGVSTKSISKVVPTDFTDHAYKKVRSLRDLGVVFNYRYKIWKKLNIFISSGLDISQSRHYQPIFENGGAQLDNIEISKNRLTVHLGVNKEFHFYDSKLILDIGCHVVDRYYSQSPVEYSSGYKSNNEDWIMYDYKLTTYHDKYYENESGIENKGNMYLNLEFSTDLKFKLKENLYLNFGFNYARNNTFFYDYEYSILYFADGSDTPTSSYTFQGITGNFNPKFANRDHYLYTSLGLSYKFDWKKE